MRWSDVPYQGPPDGNWSSGIVECRGLVLHIAEGSFDGTISWMKNPVSQVSAHFVIARDGRIVQMLDTGETAWTQAAGNGHWVSVENEGFATEGFSAEQTEANAQLYAWLLRTHGVPAQPADSPSGRGLGWHGMGGIPWGNHPGCPGAANVALRPVILARAVTINGGTTSGEAATDMIGLRDPEGGEWTVGMSALSATGYYYTPVGDVTRSAALQAGGVKMVQNGTRPKAFGPSAAEVRTALIADIAAKVVASLPPSSGGAAPTLAQITAAVRAELDATKLGKI